MGSLGFWLMVALAAFVLSMGVTAVSYRVTEALSTITDLARRRLARDAATFGEPTREQVEESWTDTEVEVEKLGRRGGAA